VGLRERQLRNLDQRAAKALEGLLEPGEAIASVTFGQSRPRGWIGLDAIIGVFALFATKYWYLVLTNRRLFMVRTPKTPGRATEVVWAEPFSAIAVDRFKRGRLWMLLYVRRVSDGQVIRYRAQRTGPGATANVAEAARLLREARAGLPG
jgi:hypothetical protein